MHGLQPSQVTKEEQSLPFLAGHLLSSKYRLIVRFVSFAALLYPYSHELPRYGLEVGLSNYAAAYCTGLLLKQLDLDQEYEGNVEVSKRCSVLSEYSFNNFFDQATGEDYLVEPADNHYQEAFPWRWPHKDKDNYRKSCFWSFEEMPENIFLEPALDGGLDIPHSDKRFALLDFQRIARALTLRFSANTSMVGMFLVSSYMKVHAAIHADSDHSPKKFEKPPPN
ncbi:60S ribosomal protein L5-1 [Bienertia sinuspersici]